MKTVLLGSLLLATAITFHAQVVCPPAVQWQTNYGTCDSDILRKVLHLPDGGYLFAGESRLDFPCEPPVGNRTSPPSVEQDIWLLRTDAAGNILWDRSYGWPGFEFLADIILLPDGGFLVGGHNFWMARLDRNGNTLWERFFGAGDTDNLVAIQRASSGNFLLAGYSASPPGPNKTAPQHGLWDFWLVLIDANGQKLWDQSFGDHASDQLGSLTATRDGGFVFGGVSAYFAQGIVHAKLVRLDAAGNVRWQKILENYGIASLREIARGDLAVGGTYRDGETFRFGLACFDLAGNLRWEKSYGGIAGADLLASMDITPDGGFILGGGSYSQPGRDRTAPHHGEYDFWVVRTDSNGNKLWDLSFGSGADEYLYSLQATRDGGFILGGSANDWNAPDSTFGFDDYHVIKLGPEDCDSDGIPDLLDRCPSSPAGAIVNHHGCTLGQLAPCDGPWKNHAHYVLAVLAHLACFVESDLITPAHARQILRQAVKSNCGKRRR